MSKLPSQFPRELEALNLALTHNGCEITLESHGQAVRFRQRCYELRKILRERNDVRFESLTLPRPEGAVIRILPQSEAVPMVMKPLGEAVEVPPIATPELEPVDDDLLDIAKSVRKGLNIDL